jgi:DNA-binding transcriptional LysR family regulator
MLDPVTIDQLRTLIAAVDAGSFSAAGRKLRRVQSAVSTSMANLEAQLGVAIWDRSSKIAVLTEEGRAVLARARRVAAEMDALRAFTTELAGGLEPRVSICVDALFPVEALVEGCAAFAETFPGVDLRVDTQALSSVSARVLEGVATLGIVSPLGVRPSLATRALGSAIPMIPVVAASHPLAALQGHSIPTPRLSEHVQIVLSERSASASANANANANAEGVPDQAVLSPRTWRVADLATKRAMLLRGLGWGNLPSHLAAKDLVEGRLVQIRPTAWAEHEHTLSFYAVHRAGEPLGRAHAHLLESLERQCAALAAGELGPLASRAPALAPASRRSSARASASAPPRTSARASAPAPASAPASARASATAPAPAPAPASAPASARAPSTQRKRALARADHRRR